MTFLLGAATGAALVTTVPLLGFWLHARLMYGSRHKDGDRGYYKHD